MASTYIEYAKGGSDFRAKGTISCWVKRGSLGVQQDIWSWGENNSSDCYLRFDTADNIEMHCDGGGSTVNTTSLYRDVNGWYHFVFSIDGENSTANLRRRFWINGVQVDEGLSSLASFNAAVFGWHSTQDLWIGGRARSQQSGATEYFDGLMSHFHYCSNYSYAASDFGSFDSTTGEWKINTSPNVQYGSEGFFLKMENSSNMDLDSSGNNKTLTTSGTLTATKDCPSNVFCTMNPLMVNPSATNTFANGNNTVTINATDACVGGTLGANSGKFYWEQKWTQQGANDRWGVCPDDAAMSSHPRTTGIGWDTASTQFYLLGSAVSGSWGGSIGTSEIIQIALDLDNSALYLGVNGTWRNSGNPTSGSSRTGAVNFSSSSLVGKFLLPAFGKGNQDNSTMQYNFGNGYFGTTAVATNSGNGYAGAEGKSIFNYQPPTGYSALSTKGLNE